MWIAASGAQKALLEEEFPSLCFVELPGYKVKYGRNRLLTLLKIIFTIPKILIRIKQEKDWMKQFFIRERPDAVISDNRYGLYTPGLYSIFITHQLRIRTPLGRLADSLIQQINYRYINRFSQCWVPDHESGETLAGELSHPVRMPAIPTRYIGLLSRMEKHSLPPGPASDLLILLSGPEPQRTIFEESIIKQLPSLPGKTILVRGLPKTKEEISPKEILTESGSGEIRVFDHLPAGALNAVMLDARLVIARAGYSTIMDLIALEKKSILIPTPGQTEQEYLGDHLARRHLALCIPQSGFSISQALEAAGNFPFTKAVGRDDKNLLQKEIRAFLFELAKTSSAIPDGSVSRP
ncbi:glycosyltransferase [Flavitalea flava]